MQGMLRVCAAIVFALPLAGHVEAANIIGTSVGPWTRINLPTEDVRYIEALQGQNVLFWRGPSSGTLRRATYGVAGPVVTLGPITNAVGLTGIRGDKSAILHTGGGNLEGYFNTAGPSGSTMLSYATSADSGVNWSGLTTVTVGPFPTPGPEHPPDDSGQSGGGGIIEIAGERRLYAQNNFGEIIVAKGTAGSSGPLPPVASLIAPTPNAGIAGSGPDFFENQAPSGDAILMPNGEVLYFYVDGEGGEATLGAVGALVLDAAGTGFTSQLDNFVTVSDAGLVAAGMTRLDEMTVNNVSFAGNTVSLLMFLDGDSTANGSLEDIFYTTVSITFDEDISGVIPEPSSLVLWSLLAALVVAMTWRRHRRAR